MLYCVPESHAVAAILKEYNNDIRRFLQRYNPDPNAEYGIQPEVGAWPRGRRALSSDLT
jgi:hypothetical protein